MKPIRRLIRRLRGPQVTIAAVVHRADGTVEDLGVISKGRIKYSAADKEQVNGQG